MQDKKVFRLHLTDKEICKQTGLTLKELRAARRGLIKKNVIGCDMQEAKERRMRHEYAIPTIFLNKDEE